MYLAWNGTLTGAPCWRDGLAQQFSSPMPWLFLRHNMNMGCSFLEFPIYILLATLEEECTQHKTNPSAFQRHNLKCKNIQNRNPTFNFSKFNQWEKASDCLNWNHQWLLICFVPAGVILNFLLISPTVDCDKYQS